MKGTGSEDAAKVVSVLPHLLESGSTRQMTDTAALVVGMCKQLQASGLEFAFHDDFNAAAAHAVKAAKQGHL